jgi:hypothetical protein
MQNYSMFGCPINFCGKGLSKQYNRKIHPNPADHFMRIETAAGVFNIEIITGSGKVIFRQRQIEGADEIDVSGLPPGIYVLRLRQGIR